ncbi:hypothetical protein GH733_005417 [Mirounga leonina]|nr:hypothetical protein GH733_005417 [Mirounga leonina]
MSFRKKPLVPLTAPVPENRDNTSTILSECSHSNILAQFYGNFINGSSDMPLEMLVSSQVGSPWKLRLECTVLKLMGQVQNEVTVPRESIQHYSKTFQFSMSNTSFETETQTECLSVAKNIPALESKIQLNSSERD